MLYSFLKKKINKVIVTKIAKKKKIILLFIEKWWYVNSLIGEFISHGLALQDIPVWNNKCSST